MLYAPLRPLAAILELDVKWDGAVQLTTARTRVEADSLEELLEAIAPPH